MTVCERIASVLSLSASCFCGTLPTIQCSASDCFASEATRPHFSIVVTGFLLQRNMPLYPHETNIVVSEAARQQSQLINSTRLASLNFRFGQRVAGKSIMGSAQATRSWGTLVTLVAKHACRGEGLWSQPR